MKKITHDVTALIIARITGSITQDEQTLLDKLLKKFPQIRELSHFLNENPPATAVVRDPATLRQEARNIINMTKATTKPQKINYLPWVVAAACIAAALVVAKIWHSPPPMQQNADAVRSDSTNITLLLESDTLVCTGQKVTINLDKGLLINDSKLLRPIKHGDKDLMATLIVPAGKVYTLELSDGTKSFINSDTRITFPIRFKELERSIDVKGEAFFTVNASATRPFIVHLPYTDVKALGTQFNVNSYNEKQPRIALVSGSAKITSGPAIKELKPGQAATRLGNKLEVGPIEDAETSWLQGEIHINDADENKIVEITWRYFHQKLTIEKPSPNNRVTAVINRKEPIDSFLVQLVPLHKIKRDASGYYIRH